MRMSIGHGGPARDWAAEAATPAAFKSIESTWMPLGSMFGPEEASLAGFSIVS